MDSGRVFLVDDDASVLKALTRLLRATGFDVSAFQSPSEFLLHHDMRMPGCVVLDVGLGDCNGLDLHRSLASNGHRRPTVFITGRGNIPMGVRAMKSGAVDFLTKPVQEEELVGAIRKAIEHDLRDRAEEAKIHATNKQLASLTPREAEVLARVVSGRLNKQVAADLGISEKTVKVHRGRVMAKMGVRSVADLVRIMDRTSADAE